MKTFTSPTKVIKAVALIWTLTLAQAMAQSIPPSLPPLPSPSPTPTAALPPPPPGLPPGQQVIFAPTAPTLQTAAAVPPVSTTPIITPVPSTAFQGVPPVGGTAGGPIVITPPTVVPPAAPSNPGALVWDSEQKEYKAKVGEANAFFTFNLTNISTSDVVVNSVRPSCGCTTAKLPPMPWTLIPGTNGQIDLTVSLAGKSGTIVKSVTVDSSAGVKSLILRVDIPTAPVTPVTNSFSGVRSEAERASNMQSALADRQAIFKGDCAKCHVEPTVGKVGQELYVASCGICHDAEHRATMVPDLKALPHPTNADFWKLMITSGKPGTLMPAFSIKEGGNLNDEQINSLVQYLVQAIPANPPPAATSPKGGSAATPGSNPNISVLPVPTSN